MKNLEQVYNLYFKDVYLYLRALTKVENLAEDLSQETFFKAIKGIDKYEGKCDIRVWLCQIGKNTYYSNLKKHKKELIEEIHETEIDSSISIEEKLLNKEQAVKIHKLLHNMEEPYKEVFHLRVFGELSFREIGDIFSRKENWARVVFYRAKGKIQQLLEKEEE